MCEFSEGMYVCYLHLGLKKEESAFALFSSIASVALIFNSLHGCFAHGCHKNEPIKHIYATIVAIIVTIGSSGSDIFPEQIKLVSAQSI